MIRFLPFAKTVTVWNCAVFEEEARGAIGVGLVTGGWEDLIDVESLVGAIDVLYAILGDLAALTEIGAHLSIFALGHQI